MNANSNLRNRIFSDSWVLWAIVGVILLAGTSDLQSQQVPITALAQMPNGQLLSGSDAGLQLHDETTLKTIKTIKTDIEKIYSIRISPDQDKFAISGGVPAELGVVDVFSMDTFERMHHFGPFDDVATDCVWISNKRLVGCSMKGNCCHLLAKQNVGKDVKTPFNVHSKGILGIASLSAEIVVTAGIDNTIRVWELEKHTDSRVLNNHVDIVNQIAVRPPDPQTGKTMMVTVSDDATVRFWQPTIGRMVRFARMESIPTCVVWNHAGTAVVVGTRAGQIHFVDPATAEIVQTTQAAGWINCLALSSDESTVFVGGESGLHRVNISKR